MDVELPDAEPILGAYVEHVPAGRTLDDALWDAKPFLATGLVAGILVSLAFGLGAGSAAFFGFVLVALAREIVICTPKETEKKAT
ncbi:MAG: hypothetical protein QOE90_2117 [Thermoplasmata archaeon]|jgi:hypothetical protein|nr:hypothetical protein [Thermoplasmata archaeon]